MHDLRMTNEYDQKEKISVSCLVVSAVFFMVLSQFILVVIGSETFTMIFRPIIVFAVLLSLTRRKTIAISSTHVYAFFVCIAAAVSLLVHAIDVEKVSGCASDILYALMFVAVTVTPWNKREIRMILLSCFLGAFVCAAIMFASNPITDFSVGKNGNVAFMNTTANRNKNAYAFNIGAVIGIICLVKGKNIPKLIVGICTAVLVYGILYSQCRGAFFSFVAACAVMAIGWIAAISKKNPRKAFSTALALIIASVSIYFLLKNSELSRLIDGESTSGRDSGIKEAWGLFLNADVFDKIFGCGYSYEVEHMTQIRSHLVYTCYLLNVGIFGTLFLIMIFISMVRKFKGGIPLAFFVLGFVRTFFELLDYYIYIPLIIALVIFNYVYYTKEDYGTLFSRGQ